MSGLKSRLAALRDGAGRDDAVATEGPAGRADRPVLPRAVPGEGLRRVRTSFRPGARHGAARLDGLAEGWSPREAAALGRLEALPEAPAELCFLDAETTGLGLGAGMRAFLVGFATLRADGAVEVEQLWMPAMRLEPELLDEVASRLSRAGAWVSFNGKSFDLPLLESRAAWTGASWPARPHLDLLHPARRFFGHALDDARLGSLESGVLGFERRDDVSGADAPAAWFRWLRTGCEQGMQAVLRHNLWDLLSLVTLLRTLLRLVEGDRELPHDPLALAEWLTGRGRRGAARALLTASARPSAGRRGLRAARLEKRLVGAPAAAPAWRRLIEEAATGPEPWEELAKLLEHRERDPAGARELVEEALRRFGRRARVRARLEHRLARLVRKCATEEFPRLGRSD